MIHRAYTAPPDVKTTQSGYIDWTPEAGSRRWGRPKRTWQDTCREDMQEMGVSGSDTHEARSIASDRAQWRRLVAKCYSRDRRT